MTWRAREVSLGLGPPAAAAASGKGWHSPSRNVSLDYVRTTALLLMCLVHMWRKMLRWAAPDLVALAIGEAAPCLFFVAFGMTQRVLVQRAAREQREHLLILLAIAVLHCYFAKLSLAWEFFLFLWASAVLVLLGQRLGMGPRTFLTLAAAVAVLNVVVPLGVSHWVHVEVVDRYVLTSNTDACIAFARRLWVLPGPFFPLPWAILVFFGFWLGLDYPRQPGIAVLWAAGLALIAAALRGLASRWPGVDMAHHLAISKWGATSTYMLVGSAGSLLVLGGSGVLHRVAVVRRFIYPAVRFVSVHVLEGTVFHYLVVTLLTWDRFGWRGGGMRPRAPLQGVILASVLNVVLLVGGLTLAVRVWRLLRDTTWALIGEISVSRLAAAGICWLVALHVVQVAGWLPDNTLSWLAYSGMLVVALSYGESRDRRRTGQHAVADGP